MSELDQLDEEFTNFLHKVTQVNNIVQKLASSDKNLQKVGNLEAEQFLGADKCADLDESDPNLKIKCDRTVINRKALLRDDNPETQSQGAFMEEMSKDADRRYQEKVKRKERMETFKKQANLAFRRGEHEKALSLYNKGIELIKDSPLLYCNRALTYINLKFYDKAVEDCETALRFNEDSLRARLLLAKAHFLGGASSDFEKAIDECKQRNSKQAEFVEDFVRKLKTEEDP